MKKIFKIKNFDSLYRIKLKTREYKKFFKTLIYLFLIKTPIKLVNNFIYNFFFQKKIKSIINNYTFNDKYIFTDHDWFIEKLPLFINYFTKNLSQKQKTKDILEIGSYEGRSAVFFNEFFNLKSFTAVDTWGGSDEHGDKIKQKMAGIEKNFDHNLKYFKNIIKIKSTSDHFFKKNIKYYDLILIDGSHKKLFVTKDLNNSFKYLNKNGYLLIDDFDFIFYNLRDNVASSFIDFYHKNKNFIEIIYIYQQILIKKI